MTHPDNGPVGDDDALAHTRREALAQANAHIGELEQANMTTAGQLAAALTQVGELQARLTSSVGAPGDPQDDHHSGTTGQAEPATTPAQTHHHPKPVFPDAQQWAEQWFGPVLTRRNLRTWCGQWHTHPEAVLRLDALWRTWEQARLDSVSGMASWLITYADPHLEHLTTVDGPFAGCDSTNHELLAPTLSEPPEPAACEAAPSNVVEYGRYWAERGQAANTTSKEHTG